MASALLVLLLFNAGGYLLLLQYLIYYADNHVETQIAHAQYKKSELVEVKIPVHMRAAFNYEDYEPIDGRMQHNGSYYNYVALKITRDTLFLLCLPNYEKSRLVNQKKAHHNLPKSRISESKYDYQPVQFSFLLPVILVQKKYTYSLTSWDNPFLVVNCQPPDRTV